MSPSSETHREPAGASGKRRRARARQLVPTAVRCREQAAQFQVGVAAAAVWPRPHARATTPPARRGRALLADRPNIVGAHFAFLPCRHYLPVA
eukprot:355465-Chlamydomonas_euryale.AAC.2